jgi:hypothetical protein
MTRAVAFALDVVVPALMSTVILSALLANEWMQHIWVFHT